jgi:hypothetical protein
MVYDPILIEQEIFEESLRSLKQLNILSLKDSLKFIHTAQGRKLSVAVSLIFVHRPCANPTPRLRCPHTVRQPTQFEPRM